MQIFIRCNVFGLWLCLVVCGEAKAGVGRWPQGGRVLYPPNVQAQSAYQESLLNRQLDAAEKGLESASKQLAEARRQQARASADFQKHVRKLQEVSAEVRHEYDTDPKLVEARQQLAALEAEYHELHTDIMRRLQEQPDYRAAVAAREKAAARVRSLATESAASELRIQAAKELSEAMTNVNILEDRAIRANASAVSAQQRRNIAIEKLTTLVSKQREAKAKDQRLTSAKLGRQRTREALDSANSQLAQAEHFALESERAYQSLTQQHLAWENQRRANYGGNWYGWPMRRNYSVWW